MKNIIEDIMTWAREIKKKSSEKWWLVMSDNIRHYQQKLHRGKIIIRQY
jgi:hypothetical protein